MCPRSSSEWATVYLHTHKLGYIYVKYKMYLFFLKWKVNSDPKLTWIKSKSPLTISLLLRLSNVKMIITYQIWMVWHLKIMLKKMHLLWLDVFQSTWKCPLRWTGCPPCRPCLAGRGWGPARRMFTTLPAMQMRSLIYASRNAFLCKHACLDTTDECIRGGNYICMNR